MERRETVNEKLIFNISPRKEYKCRPFCTWDELIKTKGPMPGDIIQDMRWDETIVEEPSWGMERDDDYPRTYYAPSITIIRPRPENDSEFEQRMKLKARLDKSLEEKEKLEYLRLKAKYEEI